MHSLEFVDFAPPQDGQTLPFETLSGVVSLRGWRVERVIGGAAYTGVDSGSGSVTLGVDSEDGDVDVDPAGEVVCLDEVADLDVFEGGCSIR